MTWRRSSRTWRTDHPARGAGPGSVGGADRRHRRLGRRNDLAASWFISASACTGAFTCVCAWTVFQAGRAAVRENAASRRNFFMPSWSSLAEATSVRPPQGLEEADRSLQPRQPDLRQLVFGLEQRARAGRRYPGAVSL